MRSRAIMDAVEHGESFVVTRDGRPMGQLIPLRRRFVTRHQFADASSSAATPDLARLREDSDAWLQAELDDPYAR
jgi:antitoxin (DNA-binding transcriptional repressor) of toxin-antitoxin stability system